VDTAQQPPAVLSLCTGYGGIEIGLCRVFGEINELAHVEIEAFAIANLVNKMEKGKLAPAPVWTDVKTFNAGIFRGFIDILTGGYPCQPFSTAGKRKGKDDPRHLWPYITQIIKDCNPRWVFFENVEGHLSKGIGKVLGDLEKLGYKPAAGLFSAVEVGAPHQRKRIFILAYDRCARSKIGLSGPDTGEEGYSEVFNDSSYRRWPARPGKPQYEWEEPRVLGDSEQPIRRSEEGRLRSAGNERRSGSPGDDEGSIRTGSETQSQLGRAVDGTRNRVDRLRLLGNGVVPATAEKAFRVLYQQLVGVELEGLFSGVG